MHFGLAAQGARPGHLATLPIGLDPMLRTLQAKWRLTTGLALPWRPVIDLDGSTIYVLNEEQNKVVEHIESWSISGTQALLQLFKPGDPNSL